MSLPSLERVHATEASPIEASSASGLRTPAPQGVASVRQTVSSQASISPWRSFQPVMDFFASIFQTIVDFFKSIFDFFSRKIQTGTGDIPAIVYGGVYEGFTVNVAKISNMPNQLDLPLIQPNAESATSSISMHQLFTEFDRIYDPSKVPDNQPLFENHYYVPQSEVPPSELPQSIIMHVERGMKRDQARMALSRYTEIVDLNRDNECRYNSTISSAMDRALKRIIFELREPADGTEEDEDMIGKKKTAIENLCRVSFFWRSRLLKEAFKTCRFLSGQRETLDEIVHQYVQDAKEELFFEYYSNACHSEILFVDDGRGAQRIEAGDSKESMLNYIRKSVGQQLGLDVNLNNFQDPHIEYGCHYTWSPSNSDYPDTEAADFLRVFNRIYTPQSILYKMKKFLNERIASDVNFAQVITDFIAHQIQAYQDTGELVPADTADMPMPYQSNTTFHLTDEGVKFIMVHFGILNSVAPLGHLVMKRAIATV